MAATLTRSGTLAGTPFPVTDKYREAGKPSLVGFSGGATIGYQRVTLEDVIDDVSRVFTRALSAGEAKRGRAAGH